MTEIATFAGGCFWCIEAVFKRVKGVIEVIPGYTGGKTSNPDYEAVSSGSTDHAEAIQIAFDAKIVSFDTLLDIFFATHDPTTLNRQGNDVGTQYRSIIFYHTKNQKEVASKKIKELESSKKFRDPIVTELSSFDTFHKAEDYHLNYYDTNPLKPYCQVVIDPKIRKLLENYSENVKEEYKK